MTDYKTSYECAVEFVRGLIQEANEQGEKILRLEAEIRELRAQADELRFNPNHDPDNGRFTSAESGGKGVDISGKSGIIEASATGANELKVKGFKNKQALNNHWKNGRTHQAEYEKYGITTAEQYEKRAVELFESPCSSTVLGYKTETDAICRYDVVKNDYVKGTISKGIFTMFKPIDGKSYFEEMKNKEGVIDEYRK